MGIFLPDSPVTAKGLNHRQKRIAVERLRENRTDVENKVSTQYVSPINKRWYLLNFPVYGLSNATRWSSKLSKDMKIYLFFFLGCVCNIPNGGISKFGTLIIKGFGFSTLVTTLMQVHYGFIIAVSILLCVYLNDCFSRSGRQRRCWMILVFFCPNTAGAFGLGLLADSNQSGRLFIYHLTGPYNAAFVSSSPSRLQTRLNIPRKWVTNAALILGCCTGNIAGHFFYLTTQAPHYLLGIWSMIVSHIVEACMILLLRFLLSREKERRDRIQGVIEWGIGWTSSRCNCI